MRAGASTEGGSGSIRVGVAGWDYPDWEGLVYPRAGGLDRLAYLARFVDVVEINSTFYRPNAPRAAERWARTALDAGGLRFTAKAHRSWTHEATDDLGEAVALALAGLRPLREAGVLAAVLVQFPQRFHAGSRAYEHLRRLAEHSLGWPVAIEVRHAGWNAPEAHAQVRQCGFAWCVVDQPRIAGSTLGREPVATSTLGYLRLHGRNTPEWFRQGAGRDARYDYRYDRREVAELVATARTLAGMCEQVVVVYNNHFRGQALANALETRFALTGTRAVAPAALMRAYPDLADSADPAEPALF